ncbi:hypothetical protein VPH35_013412 [Triticum aestivum]
MPLRREPRWWLLVGILDIKLRDRLATNRSHIEKCAKSGHVGYIYKSRCLFVVMTMLSPLNELCVTLKRIINLVDPLTSDETSTGGREMKFHVPMRASASIFDAITCSHLE